MQDLVLKPTHKLVKSYYETLGQYGQLDIDHEMAVRSAFQALLRGCGKQFEWTLVPEYPIHKPKAHIIKVDGALVDPFRLARGFWEAKDEHDDLEREIRAKFDRGYPKTNIIFQAPEKAILFQNGVRQGLNEDIRDGGNLVELLKVFFGYREPHHEEWDEAVAAFKDRIPAIAQGVKDKIEAQRRTNPEFVQRFEAFYDVCRQSINPNLSVEAVETMLIQHLMTERIFRRIFDNPDFARRNVIAVEIEKVIDELTRKQSSRNEFLKGLDHFYRAIELAAESTQDYTEKQQFMNSVYERFFQGFSPKEADTHGIVYTPQPIVDFMVRSVEDILKNEFGRSLSDKGVHILDPFVGTGNFITRVMKEIKTSALPYKYEHELHCNEVMLLPYYVASINIEHEYLERTGEYQAFPGICLVDTFDMQAQSAMFAEENTSRIARQRLSPIFVVIGNPPYNVGQVNENDNNKNRKYRDLDRRISETYAKASRAVNKNALSDPYVKAIRWASDRIKDEGVTAFVTNNGFVEALAADGMRRTLTGEFDAIYVLDLGGNVRKNPKLSGTTHNVFGIQVGVSINLLVRRTGEREHRVCEVHYARVDEFWTKEQKYAHLDKVGDRAGVAWRRLSADAKGNWLTEGLSDDFDSFAAMSPNGIFGVTSNGVKTNRDNWVCNFTSSVLEANVRKTIGFYSSELDRWKRREDKKAAVDEFVTYDDSKISWSRDLKADLVRERRLQYSHTRLMKVLYRPFTLTFLYFDRILNEEVYSLESLIPRKESEGENRFICGPGPGNRQEFGAFATAYIPALDFAFEKAQCFPFYRYDEDGSNRRENITDWALNEFRTHYSDPNITKWDIFHYVYAVLHHPEYRQRYAANLKRELPRIPFVGVPSAGSANPLNDCHHEGASAPEGSAFPPASRRQIGGETGSPGLQRENDDWVATTVRTTKNQPLGGRDKKAQHVAAGGVLGKVGKTPESPGDDISLGHQPGFDKTGGSPGLEAGERDGAPGARSTLPKASAESDRTERPKEIFHAFAAAGKRLADLHVNYEQQPEYPLERVEKGQLDWRVEKMRLSKDKTTLVYNDFLTLKGIPPETYEYRLGNRSALEWVIDQYQVSTDKRSGITNDPNRADDPEYILRLIGQVITVSLETMKIVKSLPELQIDLPSAGN